MATTRGAAKTSKRTASPRQTTRQNSEKGFVASTQLLASMQKVLVDLLELQLQGKQAHWNVVGTNFRDTHRILDEIIDASRVLSDAVAERMRALHGIPDGRSATVAKTTTLAAFPDGEVDTTHTIDLVTAMLEAVVIATRGVHDTVDEEDPTSADLLHQVIERLEQFAWMVSAENRSPA